MSEYLDQGITTNRHYTKYTNHMLIQARLYECWKYSVAWFISVQGTVAALVYYQIWKQIHFNIITFLADLNWEIAASE